jgi:ankyrin repeat protein
MWAGRAGRETTPLHVAIVFGSTDIVEMLLDCGVETDVINDSGETAIDIANKWGCTDIAEILKKHGAKTSAEIK